MGDLATDRRGGTHCALVFLNRDGSTSRPLRQPTALRVRRAPAVPATEPWREASRAARRLESARHRCRKNGVKPSPARPSAARSHGPRRCPRRYSLIGTMSRISRTARASGRTASATPFFGLTETARRSEMLLAAACVAGSRFRSRVSTTRSLERPRLYLTRRWTTSFSFSHTYSISSLSATSSNRTVALQGRV
jgi:hypothetical protein